MRKKENYKSNKKLFSAFAMFLLSGAMLGTATYAWFTMNREVTVTGMELKTKVGSNLLVCDTNVEADYSDDLVQSRKALLEPVSTINANDEKFYYTVNAAADGHWLRATGSMLGYTESSSTTNSTSTALGKAGYDSTFNGTYGISTPAATDFGTAYGYVDYVFYLKATSDANNSAINLTECNLICDNQQIGTGDNAWRVAIFAKEISEKGDGTTNQDLTSTSANASTSNLVSILDIDTKSLNWTADNAVTDTTGTLGAVASAGSNVTFGSVNAGDTKYYKVVARVWLEGEDKSCNSQTYAALRDKIWELGLQFELGQGTAVNTISSVLDNDTGTIMTGSGTSSGTP
jgi:hypothetical protein